MQGIRDHHLTCLVRERRGKPFANIQYGEANYFAFFIADDDVVISHFTIVCTVGLGKMKI
jgi:hypothetical protein